MTSPHAGTPFHGFMTECSVLCFAVPVLVFLQWRVMSCLLEMSPCTYGAPPVDYHFAAAVGHQRQQQ